MRVYSLLFMMLFALSIGANAQVKFFTDVNSKQIKTLQVKVAGELIFRTLHSVGRRRAKLKSISTVWGVDTHDMPITWCIATPTGRNRS